MSELTQKFTGIHHVAVTVSDLERSTAFYEMVLGFPPAGELNDDHLQRRLFALPGGVNLGLTKHAAPTSEKFSPFRPGLDHLGLGVATREELQGWADHLDRIGVEHSELVDASYGTALNFADPDGTAIEFFVGR